MEHLALVLLQILELSLNLPRGYLGDHMHRHTSILTVNHYPINVSTTTATANQQPSHINYPSSIDNNHNNNDNPPPPLSQPSPPSQTTLLSPSQVQVRVAEHTDVSMLTIVAASGTNKTH